MTASGSSPPPTRLPIPLPVIGPGLVERAGLLSLLLILLAACGYRPVGATLPGDVRKLRVMQPSPGKTGAPALSRMMAAELIRALGRVGVTVTTSGNAHGVLETRLLDLRLTRTVLSPARARVAARGLQLRVEFRLRDASDATLWRSGLVVASRTWPLDGQSSEVSEGSRRATLSELAADAARQCVELMTSGL